MGNKPITVLRAEFIKDIVGTINASHLPAFIKVEVLERVLAQLRPQVDAELKRDTSAYESANHNDKQEEE